MQIKRVARAVLRLAVLSALLSSAVLLSTLAVPGTAYAQFINKITSGIGGVGSLMLGYGQSASGTSQAVLLTTGSGAPTSGTTGTRAGLAPPASLYIDVTNKNVYQNTNTQASPTWSPVVGDDAIRYATVTLTDTQIKALNTTGVTIVAAPGAGKFIETLGGTLTFASTTTAYTLNSNNLALYWGSRATGNRASNAILAAGLLDQVTTGLISTFAGAGNDTNPSITQQAVVIMNTLGTAMTGGNAANTLKVNLAYRIRTY